MKTVFADTFYFIALLSTSDAAHAQATNFAAAFSGRVVTTDWILTELADGLANSAQRSIFAAVRRDLKAAANNTLVPYNSDLFEAAVELYSQRLDKSWSLTDCTSFVAMQQHGITAALTADRHFEQAGFEILLG